MKATAEQRQEIRKNLLRDAPMHTLIPRMAGPAIISFLITSIYNLADTYFVSSLGTNATAAVSVNASLDQIIMMAGSMLAMGASSYLSRLLGEKREEYANRVLSVAFFLAALFGAVVLVLGSAFMTPMVRLLGATPTCEQYAIEYATYVVLVAPFMACSFVMNQALRAEGSATLSMIGMAFGGILNCILDPIFIFTLDMGVAGASLATAISKLVSFSILVFPYLRRRTLLRFSLRQFKPNKDILGQIVAVGSSSMLRNALAVVSAIILNNIAGNISDAVLAGIGVTNKIMMFPFGVILGLGSGFQPVAGFNWGAKRYDRVRAGYRFSSRLAFFGGLAMALVLAFFAEPIIGLFGKTDPEMLRIGALALRLNCLAMPIHAWVAIVNMLCASLGYAKGAFLLATSRQGSCFLPIVHLVARIGGAVGVASVQAIADALSFLLAFPLMRHVMKKVTEAEQLQAARQNESLPQ